MITFSVSKKFDVSPQAVWNIVKDVNSIPKYWKGTRELHVNKVAEGIYEGVVRFAFPSKGRIRLIVDDENRKLTFNYLSGPIKGYNIVEVKENEIISSWRVKMSLLLALAESWNAKHFKQGTEHALDRIISEAKSGIP
ncbi:SRPBCC family protein [Acidianus ambivalens]|uniref:SRPBCC family protein n=1 Tax=Acidianus ambivalens TaxID=2283 RepID=A0A650CW03_ACIAM|nr:SRPBCC family protein [Acidianus ambivalens]MQL54219.1 SRPBCC family protein [Acidianus ambivalens]QGR22051.1 SRPBCC family protein [Acidianus ambivalens]